MRSDELYQNDNIGPGIFANEARITLVGTFLGPTLAENRPKTDDLLKKMVLRTLPRDPPGERGPRKKIKIILSTSRMRIETGY